MAARTFVHLVDIRLLPHVNDRVQPPGQGVPEVLSNVTRRSIEAERPRKIFYRRTLPGFQENGAHRAIYTRSHVHFAGPRIMRDPTMECSCDRLWNTSLSGFCLIASDGGMDNRQFASTTQVLLFSRGIGIIPPRRITMLY